MTTSQGVQPAHRSERLRLPEPLPAAARAFFLLGRGCNGLVLAALAKGPATFAQVRDRVPGISEQMLTDCLQELAAVGLVARIPGPGSSSAAQYTLSPHGNAFLIPLAAVIVWAEEHLPSDGSLVPADGPLRTPED